MKKILYAVLATLSGLVLLFSYRTSHVEATVPVAADTPASGSATSGTGSSSEAGSSSAGTGSSSAGTGSSSAGTADAGATGTADAAAGAASTSSALRDGTYTGSAANTRFGPVQVQITVSGGAITDVQVPEYPSTNPRDRQINERALPTLISETTDAQSADIDMVSGATYTSQGYLTSLQSAIDQASS